RALARSPGGAVAAEKGDIDAALSSSQKRLEAEYDVPYLAHATMEPMNATVKLEGDRCDVWTGTQFQTMDQANAARIAGVPPEKVVWTREDDMHGGYYRPLFLHRMEAGLDGKGMPVAWKDGIVGQSILAGTPFEKFMVKNGVDATSVEGVVDSPYLAAMPARRVMLQSPKLEVPVLWWRSVGNTHTAFAMESMIDELAW